MKFRTLLHSMLPVLLAPMMMAQIVASHAPTKMAPAAPAKNGQPTMELIKVQVTGKTVLRVNGRELTDRDLLHEMYALFPYAQQHGGFPKSLENEIREGARQMLVFEELVYQEGERRKMVIAPQRIRTAENDLRKQLGGQDGFKKYVQVECNGNEQVLKQRIRRSLLIEDMLKQEVYNKATPTEAQLQAFYNKNIAAFKYGDSIHIQTVSVIPPAVAGAKEEAKKKVDKAYAEAKHIKTYKDFGLLAEKYSDDDWHVRMGDRKWIETAKMPPPITQAAAKMKPGDISPIIQFDNSYTFFRLIERKPAGKTPFAQVRKEMKENLQKKRTEELRAQLNQKLHKGAKIEQL